MPTRKDFVAVAGGEELAGSGFEDEQPDLDFADADQSRTEGPDQ